jgi:hypothetical protein
MAATVVNHAPINGGNTTFSAKNVEKGFIATGFALTSATVLTGASFTVSPVNGAVPANPASVTWRFLSIGEDGAPAKTLAEGVAANFTRSVVGYSVAPTYEDTRFGFALPSVSLAAGKYFLALHSDSSDLVSLMNAAAPASFGTAFSGYRSYEGRVSRFPRQGAYAISLSDDPVSTVVPEPASWAMMLIGFGLIGATRRYRRRAPVMLGQRQRSTGA